MATSPETRPTPGARVPSAPSRPARIDVELLADKIYQLMLEEVRLAQLRGEPARRSR